MALKYPMNYILWGDLTFHAKVIDRHFMAYFSGSVCNVLNLKSYIKMIS